MKKSFLLRVRNLSKDYFLDSFKFSNIFISNKFKKKRALNDINFNVNFGEKIAFLGKNGSGKSTLLKIISRVTSPTEGDVIIGGKIISMLETGIGFHPELTGRENIYMNAYMLGAMKNEIDERLSSIIEFAGVKEFIDIPIKRYSTGMEAKLGFSMGILLPTDLLILDELLSVVDGKFRQRCVDKIKNLSLKEKKAIIFVSHNMDLVSKICERGVVMEEGRIIYDNKIDKAISFYEKKILKNE
jgi:lipopolysaccharide transport system ATP-binding protein